MPNSFEVTHLTQGDGPRVLFVPGVLAHGELQHAPLIPLFEQRGYEVSVGDYIGPHFNPAAAIDQIVKEVAAAIDARRRLILFGSSLGGALIAHALTELREKFTVDDLNAFVSTFIVDSPADGRGPIVGPIPAGGNRSLAWFIRNLQVNERTNTRLGGRILQAFRVPPKDEAIELPSEEEQQAWFGRVYDEAGYRQYVKDTAIKGLTGHDFTLFFEEVRWMLDQRINFEALDGLDITYFRCNRNNVTIHQPYTGDLWAPHVRELVEVDTAHCAYLEARPTWMRVVNDQLKRVLS